LLNVQREEMLYVEEKGRGEPEVQDEFPLSSLVDQKYVAVQLSI